jgi:hypothetical protein
VPTRKKRKKAPQRVAHERGMSAWLVTWNGTGPQKPARDRIAAILNPRWSSERVRRIVEVLHNVTNYSLGEQAGYANNYAFNAHPAKYERVDGVQHLGFITCGHNPYLFARLVPDLKIQGRREQEVVTWTERKPQVPPGWKRRLTSA